MTLPLLVGAALLLASLLSYAIAMNLIVRVVARLIQAGLLFFGLSTGLLFAIVSHLIANRLRAEVGYRHQALDKWDFLPVPE